MQPGPERSGAIRTLALGGVAGPILFTAVTIMCAALRPGYGHFRNLISELGAHGTANATLMNYAGFIPAGTQVSIVSAEGYRFVVKPRA